MTSNEFCATLIMLEWTPVGAGIFRNTTTPDWELDSEARHIMLIDEHTASFLNIQDSDNSIVKSFDKIIEIITNV